MDSTMKDMKPQVAADEMFPEGAGFIDLEESGTTSGGVGTMDLASSEKHLHADFYNDFGDIFEDGTELP